MGETVRLHYVAPDHLIGDVHPYWDEKSGMWYMYYLKPDGYSSALLTSRDMLSWEIAPLDHTGGKLANYFVLGVVPDGEEYRSWFGYGTSMASSVGSDLHTFGNAGYGYTIPLDITKYPSGGRDPYVFFDPQEQVYRVICTAYLTNQLQGKGTGMRCMLALGATKSNALDDWGKIDTTLLSFDGLSGEPECAQVFLINGRWYIFASMARRHPNHVGRLSYWIGEEGKGLTQQDWTQKEEHFLTGEDLCAAQLAQKGNELYLWGWIAKSWKGGVWGGNLSLPLTVQQGENGVLYTSLPAEVGQAVRGRLLGESSGGNAAVTGVFPQYDAEISFDIMPGASPVLDMGAALVRWNVPESRLEIVSGTGEVHASLPLPGEALAGRRQVRVLGQEDMLEVFADGKWSLSARLEKEVETGSISILAGGDAAIAVYDIAAR